MLACVFGLSKLRKLGLWVPAFAGTTPCLLRYLRLPDVAVAGIESVVGVVIVVVLVFVRRLVEEALA